MAQTSLFDFREYKPYLQNALDTRALVEKGQRSKLAQAMNCQPAYLSQVLNGSTDLSPEQAYAANQFLGHTETEAQYFLNLVLLARAGTKELRSFYQQKIKTQLDQRLLIKNRIDSHRTLSEADQAKYYNSWHYAAVHALVALPQFRTGQSIAKALNISPKLASEALEFLVEIQILKKQGMAFNPGETRLHLGSDSPFIGKHHGNWRIKALQSLEQGKESDLHYSSVITCSKEDFERLKEVLIQTVQKMRGVVKDSNDETMGFYALDLVNLVDES